jgi:predicted HicB family RNase H-like nuclease
MRMSRTRKNAVRIVGPDVNLEDEVILDSKGRRVDQAYIELAMQEVEEELAKRAGRPSLTGTSAHSPHVSFRIPPELKARAEQAARERGTTVSKLAREAFERFLAS